MTAPLQLGLADSNTTWRGTLNTPASGTATALVVVTGGLAIPPAAWRPVANGDGSTATPSRWEADLAALNISDAQLAPARHL